MNVRGSLVVVGWVLLACNGCATLTNGSHQTVGVTSSPPGAIVRSESGQVCATPGELRLKRDSDHVLSATLPGYPPKRQTLQRKLDDALLGNILIGGIPGVVVDLASGSANKLVPERVHFDFAAASSHYPDDKRYRHRN